MEAHANIWSQYCEFGGTKKKCEEWLASNHPAMHKQIYSEGSRPLIISFYPRLTTTTEAISAGLASLSVEAQKRAEKDDAKKTAKAAAAEQREAERKAEAMVYIKRVERQKRKYVTVVSGLSSMAWN